MPMLWRVSEIAIALRNVEIYGIYVPFFCFKGTFCRTVSVCCGA